MIAWRPSLKRQRVPKQIRGRGASKCHDGKWTQAILYAREGPTQPLPPEAAGTQSATQSEKEDADVSPTIASLFLMLLSLGSRLFFLYLGIVYPVLMSPIFYRLGSSGIAASIALSHEIQARSERFCKLVQFQRIF